MSTVEGVPYCFLLDIYKKAKETDYTADFLIQEKISTYLYWKARSFSSYS